MNHRYVLLFVLLLGSNFLQAQTITLSSPAQFDTVLVNTTDSLAFWVRNSSATPFIVTDINTTRAEFWVKDTSFTVPANDSTRVFVYFKTNQNVTWKDVLVVLGRGGAVPLRWSGTGRYSDALYNPTQGLSENALKTALLNLVNNHTVLGYNIARDRMFETVDDPAGNDTIECVYSGRRIYAPTRTIAQSLGFNTEHTWPQSFFNSADPMVSDINHLYPTDAEPNNRRANYPFGPVANITWQDGTSKLGTRSTGEIVFEPRDSHKGDVSRALFYFLLRYPSNYGGFMTARQESDLRLWYKFDPVSTKEILRNNAVATFQGKRNPLIDHPEFIDRITYFYTATAPTLYPDIAASATSINFGSIASGDSVEWKLIIINNGRASLNLTSLALQTPSSSFKIVDVPTSVPIDSFRTVRLRFTPTQASQTLNNTLVIQSNDPDEGTVNIPLTGTTGTAFVVTTPMSAGWNLVSVPVTPPDFAVTSVFPSAISSAFAFGSGYEPRDTLSRGLGYWLKFGPSQSVSVNGQPVSSDTFQVNAGWNLIGSISYSVPSASVTSLPPGIIVSSFFEFTSGYVSAADLVPMRGYWVRCSQAGQLFFHGGVAVHPSQSGKR